MAVWKFIITETGETDIQRLDTKTRKRVVEKLNWFIENFEQITPLPLGGKWRGFFKLRMGDWRAVYEIDNTKKFVVIHFVNHRSRIYKRG